MTFGDWQYFGGYDESRTVVLARRRLPSGPWQKLTFSDYEQERDDGHNVVCIGISGDGVIHVSWDLHNDAINYRQSVTGIALEPEAHEWTEKLFSGVLHDLNGRLDASAGVEPLALNKTTYPRFLTLPSGDMLLELRIGRSGLGDSYLFRYGVANGSWRPVGPHGGMYLKGIENNAYINGIDCDANGALYVSWTYRDFVEDGGGEGVASQAGPNGPENNHDVYYAWSPDGGETWRNSAGIDLGLVTPSSPGIKVFTVPKNSQIMNQEGQALDKHHNFHVLNRENGHYYHYWRDASTGAWTRTQLPYAAVEFGCRGQVCASPNSENVYLLLPENDSDAFSIVRSTYDQKFSNWATVYRDTGFDGEPLYDRTRRDGVLSILQRRLADGQYSIGIIDLQW